jgi:hypothetical protein
VTPRAALVLAAILVVVLAVFGGAAPGGAQPSTHTHRARGLLLAWRYLEETGVDARRHERPLDELPDPEGGALVVALPLEAGLGTLEPGALDRWRVRGGRVLVLTSGEAPTPADQELLAVLSLHLEERLERGPLGWWSWKAWRTRTHALSPRVQGWPSEVITRAGTHRAVPGNDVEVIYQDPSGNPAVFRWTNPGRAEVVVVDSGWALANGGLALGTNLELLERLTGEGPVWFDEWHQGFGVQPEDPHLLSPSALVGAHLLLIYLAGLWSLSRPFGPNLVDPGLRRGSVSRDLLALAGLHRAGGHAREAGERLLKLARGLAGPRARELELPEDFKGDEDELVALARRVGELQADRRL